MEKTLDMMLQNSENISKEKLVKALRVSCNINKAASKMFNEYLKLLAISKVEPSLVMQENIFELAEEQIEQIMADKK